MPATNNNNKSSETKSTDRIRLWMIHGKKKLTKFLPGWTHPLAEPKWQRWGLITVTALLAAFMLAPKAFQVYAPTLGEPSKETIISPITFQVIDESATNKNRDEVLNSVQPVYDFDDEMVHDVQARIISAFGFMREYLVQELDHRSKESDPPPHAASSAQGSAAAKPQPPFRSLDENAQRTRFENFLAVPVSPSNFSALKQIGFNARIERDLRSLVVPPLLRGVALSRELVMRDGKRGILLKIKSKDKLEHLKDLATIFDLNEAVSFINIEDKDSARDPGVSRAIRRLAMDLINVNITYNREKTSALRQEALASVKPVYFQIAKSEAIIKQGEPVNEGHLKKLAGLNKANPAYSRYIILAGFCLLLIIMIRLCSEFIEKYLNRFRQATEDLLLMCILLMGTIIVVRFVSSLAPLLATPSTGMNARALLFAAPVATCAMLTALMVGARIAFVMACLTALAACLAVEGDIYLFAFYLLGGIAGLQGMTHITDRTSVLRAGLAVGLVNLAALLAIKMALGQLAKLQDFYEIGLGFVGGVLSGLLVSGLAPLLEPLGYITDVRLLEIANLNHPLLRQLALEAPGTYHHSIMVGNLVEVAAESIGANPLLARVGAYYHDIGKVGRKTKPSYFIENQARGPNPHDKLEPSMSALILQSHVKHGVEKARDNRLGRPIVDMIQQHHGSTLIKFFYNKAVERAGKNGLMVPEDKYHYPGPRPNTKEAALIMLADVVEAACRTLTDPTPARIQKRVQELILGLFNEGQLEQSNLTLKDLHSITRSYVRSLQGILHTRIQYPTSAYTAEKSNGTLRRIETEKDRNRSGGAAEENGKNIRRLGL
ncbi:MAG: HD family phosphohydrolase [Desulfomonilaceae bacterium]